MKYIGLDCHKQYDHATMIDTDTGEIKSKRPNGETSKPVPQTQDGVTGMSEVSSLGKTGMQGIGASQGYAASHSMVTT